MGLLIEDYALIGDTETVALVGRNGSIDWFCAPRFDSAASFAALLGGRDQGRWLVAPVGSPVSVSRSYRDGSLVLETVFTTETGTVAVIDFMPVRSSDASIVRIVEGRSGVVPMEMEMVIRFDYGSVVPWVRRLDHRSGGDGVGTAVSAIAGADGLVLRTPVQTQGRDLATVATFEVRAGDQVPLVLTWFPSYRTPPHAVDAVRALAETERWWHDWADHCSYHGRYEAEVKRSLVVLKALTFAPTGGIVAAATTSLPERIGGVRNWDYRFCWLRDATFTLSALSYAGHSYEALAWSRWLRRAVAGSPDKMQIMYGVAGERRLTEEELEWLPGYEGSAPVRIGNGASSQHQLDVYGEVMDMFLHSAHCLGHELPDDAWDLAKMLVQHVERVWAEPDEGIWEVRGPRRHFVHSKVMAWVAIDRWIQLCGPGRPDEPLEHWHRLRDDIHDDICTHGWNEEVGSFTQYYGSTELDASLLMMALVGFLPAEDPRISATVDAIERELMVEGFVLRYRTDSPATAGNVTAGVVPSTRTGSRVVGQAGTASVDGLPPGEGVFLLATFWLVDNLVLLGRMDEAVEIFERLLSLRNDVGLLAEEYDPVAGRLLGNLPQAFSHVGLIISASNISHGPRGPAAHRCTPTPRGSPS